MQVAWMNVFVSNCAILATKALQTCYIFCTSYASMSHLPAACMLEQVRFITGTSGTAVGLTVGLWFGCHQINF
jgi:hypothetical protein